MENPNASRSRPTPAGSRPIVVGVASPASDPQPFQSLLMNMSRGPEGVAFVFVQQESPEAKELSIEPFRRSTSMRVIEITDGIGIEPDTVYVAPPWNLLRLKGNRLQLQSLTSGTPTTTKIDHFLYSLAEQQGARSIAILLGGEGPDGALGLKAISDAGGLTIAAVRQAADRLRQTHVSPNMADLVLTPEQIIRELTDYVQHLEMLLDTSHQQGLRKQINARIPAIAELLQKATGHDFEHYKSTTLIRRIQRRMQVLKLSTADDYVTVLNANQDEVQALFRELLIGVTAFFRDREAFASLAELVLPDLFNDPGRRPIRIWVPGCATGEEAYTLAVLCREQMDRLGAPVEVQIFATDIDERALKVGRAGAYPLSIQEDLTEERLGRFFVRRGKRLHVAREIRDMVLFSPHNLVSDPPFSRQDLISCRNLLIYFGQQVQSKLIPLFHYALRPGGYLFLGPSENVSSHRELFRSVDAKQRISQRKDSRSTSTAALSLRDDSRSEYLRQQVMTSDPPDLQRLLQHVLLDEFSPKAVLVDEEGQILCASGDMDKYLTVFGGAFHNNVIKMARPGLRIGLRAAFLEAVQTRQIVRHEHLSLPTDAGVQRIMLTVRPLPRTEHSSALFLLVFQDIGLPRGAGQALPESSGGEADAIIEQLERELAHTRRDLEKSMQDMEAANEELKSSNEELLSINEELQSANEELEASQEEVQTGLDALAHANSDLANLLRSTQIATLFLDSELKIRSFTPAANAIYGLIQGDIGRPISHLMPLSDNMPPLPDPDTIPEDSPIEDTIVTRDGRSYIRRVLPYRDPSGERDGVVVTFTDVTELRTNEQRLRESTHGLRLARERLERVVDAAEFGVVFSRTSGEILHPNDAFLRMLGLSREEFQQSWLSWRDITHPDDLALADTYLQKLLQTGASGNYEKRLLRKDGSIIPVMINRQLVNAEQDEHVAFVADLSWQKEHEQRIRASEHFVRKTLDSLFTFAGVCLADGTLIEVNRPTLDAAGLEPEDVLGLPFENTYWWSYDPAVQQQLREALSRAAAGQSSRYDVDMRIADNQAITVDFQLMPMRDDEGRVTHLIPSGVDITERKRAEEELRHSESRFRTAFENAAVGMAYVGIDGTWLHVNRRLCEIVEYPREELLTRTFQDITHPEDLDADLALVQALLRGEGDEYQLEKRYIRKDGGIVWIHLSVSLLRDSTGQPVHFITVVQDITERKRAERAERESEARLQLALTAGRMGTFEWELKTGKLVWSAEHYTLLGYEPFAFEPTYDFFRSRVHPDDLADLDVRLQVMLDKGDDLQAEFRVVQPSGAEHWLLARGQCEIDPHGRPVRVFGVVADYHEIKQSHVELRIAREIAEAASQSRGEFLANMSHEIRTPMTAILGYADILAKHLEDPDDLVCVDTIQRNGRFLLDIINDILDLSKIDAGKLDVKTQRVRPEGVVADVLSLMEVRATEKGLSLKVRYDGLLPETIETDPKRLRQVLVNLVGNAIKFTDTGSVQLNVQLLEDDQKLQFDVIDTGIGIAPEHLSRLFQPFTQADASTTRSFGGTGLGLTISRRLTQMLGGDIHVESLAGVGSKFSVTIGTGPLEGVPLKSPQPDVSLPADPPPDQPQRLHGRVLVVDDRREIRYLAQHLLEEAGCDVATAIHGENALEMVADAESNGQPFDIILIDMQMPVMDGYKATELLRARNFTKPIIALTAHAMQGDRETCLQVGCTDYATKPLDGPQLVRTIAQYLMAADEAPQ